MAEPVSPLRFASEPGLVRVQMLLPDGWFACRACDLPLYWRDYQRQGSDEVDTYAFDKPPQDGGTLHRSTAVAELVAMVWAQHAASSPPEEK